MHKLLTTFTISLAFFSANLLANGASTQEMRIEIYQLVTNGIGAHLGYVLAKDSENGLELKTHLTGLPPGPHGFHLHEHPSCAAKKKGKAGKMFPGLAAGGHYDPEETASHQGPEGLGHLGDLPVLNVNEQGEATETLIAPRLKLSDLPGHALMIHEKGDNYSDTPEKLGGGGSRIACGVAE
ncbi:MAG: superoxide dismutase [Cu-Zn] SodC [Pseudomonadota bacterium]